MDKFCVALRLKAKNGIREVDLKFLPFYQLPEIAYMPALDSWEKREWIADVLKKALTPTEEQVIRMRFGLDENKGEMTLFGVGCEIGVTKERVRQIEAKALRKLRHPRWVTAFDV